MRPLLDRRSTGGRLDQRTREVRFMERQIINPWTWQEDFSFVQGNDVHGPERVLFCSGQTAVDADGNPMHPDDMRAQISLALDNVETVLHEAGLSLADVVRLNMYTTDVDDFFEHYDALTSRLEEADCDQTGTLLGVTRLAQPEMMIELEATAVSGQSGSNNH